MFILYSLLLACALLMSLPWWALQLLLRKKYRAGLAERLGFVPLRLRAKVQHGCVWIHAVSVGEVLAVSRLIAELESAEPKRPVFISTTTATGQRLARERFGGDRVFYMPVDFGFAVRAYLDLLRPSLLVLAETEFWPNLLHLAHNRGAAIATVNARISDRSFPRYRRFRRFFGKVLAEIDLLLTQTQEDAARLCAIGAPAERVQVSGNLKFDIRNAGTSPLLEDLRRAVSKDASVIVCGSTMEGEENLLLNACAEVVRRRPATIMVLAPRHPERFEAVAKMATDRGFPLIRRSSWAAGSAGSEVPVSLSAGIFLLDSIGELASLYALADVAFVGGSLLPGVGGHNILEPAQHGVPVLVGPNTYNFREIVRIFEQGGGLRVVTEAELASQMQQLLDNPEDRRKMGQQARELFVQNSGATERTLEALRSLLKNKALTVK